MSEIVTQFFGNIDSSVALHFHQAQESIGGFVINKHSDINDFLIINFVALLVDLSSMTEKSQAYLFNHNGSLCSSNGLKKLSSSFVITIAGPIGNPLHSCNSSNAGYERNENLFLQHYTVLNNRNILSFCSLVRLAIATFNVAFSGTLNISALKQH